MKHIKLDLKTHILIPEIVHFEVIDSTNTFLLNENELGHGTVVLADFQTAGRGRRGRAWLSDPGQSLLFSILLTDIPEGVNPQGFTFSTSVGVARGLSVFAGGGNIALKWPNDVLLNHKKVCGILLETKTFSGSLHKIVVGVGINVNQPSEFFSGDLAFGTSLFTETGKMFDRMEVLRVVLNKIDETFRKFLEKGFQYILAEWRQLCPYIGKKIVVDTCEFRRRGIFKGVNNEGALVLDVGGKEETYLAGDVSILKEGVYASGD